MTTKTWATLGRLIEIGKPFEWYAVHIDEHTAWNELAEVRYVGRVSLEWLAKVQDGLRTDLERMITSIQSCVDAKDWGRAKCLIEEAKYTDDLLVDGTPFYVVTNLGRKAYAEHLKRCRKERPKVEMTA